MRYLLAGLLFSLMVFATAYAQEEVAEENGESVETAEVTGMPLYEGPQYRSLDSHEGDITLTPPQFHAFQHLPLDEVGYSPLTLDDFRFPVPKRVEFEQRRWELSFPQYAMQVWHDDCHNYTVSAYFFTRDMIREHIQQLIDEYYICDPDIVQQIIDYYAEVTPQCGEAISWVWFQIDPCDNDHLWADRQPNPYFQRYLANFEDKFYLQFGLPKVQEIVDVRLREFLYQYEKRGKRHCGPEFKDLPGECCDPCACEDPATCQPCDCCEPCPTCEPCDPCPTCEPCGCCEPEPCCPEAWSEPKDSQLLCWDYRHAGMDVNLNSHYLYYPRKVVLEDMTYDHVAQAYRWKLAWRFNDCEIEWLNLMCRYGEKFELAMIMSDPQWFAYEPIDKRLARRILASVDPTTWGNVWSAGNVPFDTTCCPCPLPECPGNCLAPEPVGWDYVAPLPEPEPEPVEVVVEPEPEPAGDFTYFPPEEEEEEVIEVPGKG